MRASSFGNSRIRSRFGRPVVATGTIPQTVPRPPRPIVRLRRNGWRWGASSPASSPCPRPSRPPFPCAPRGNLRRTSESPMPAPSPRSHDSTSLLIFYPNPESSEHKAAREEEENKETPLEHPFAFPPSPLPRRDAGGAPPACGGGRGAASSAPAGRGGQGGAAAAAGALSARRRVSPPAVRAAGPGPCTPPLPLAPAYMCRLSHTEEQHQRP